MSDVFMVILILICGVLAMFAFAIFAKHWLLLFEAKEPIQYIFPVAFQPMNHSRPAAINAVIFCFIIIVEMIIALPSLAIYGVTKVMDNILSVRR